MTLGKSLDSVSLGFLNFKIVVSRNACAQKEEYKFSTIFYHLAQCQASSKSSINIMLLLLDGKGKEICTFNKHSGVLMQVITLGKVVAMPIPSLFV